MAVFANPENLTQITEVLAASNTFLGGGLGVLIYMVTFFGTLFLLNSFKMKEGLIASSFVSMIIAFFLKYMGMLNDFYLWLSAAIFAASLIFSAQKTSGGA